MEGLEAIEAEMETESCTQDARIRGEVKARATVLLTLPLSL